MENRPLCEKSREKFLEKPPLQKKFSREILGIILYTCKVGDIVLGLPCPNWQGATRQQEDIMKTMMKSALVLAGLAIPGCGGDKDADTADAAVTTDTAVETTTTAVTGTGTTGTTGTSGGTGGTTPTTGTGGTSTGTPTGTGA